MVSPQAEIRLAQELHLFLASRHRVAPVLVACDGTSTLGHVVESLGIPLTEVGSLAVNGEPAASRCRPRGGDVMEVGAVRRPQRLPAARFLLDVHLGTLARRLRVAGIDAEYANDRDDDALVELANAGQRVLLTQDRGLLRRRRLWLGAFVRGARPDDQLRDVLGRFAPPLAPWTRCTACNGMLVPAAKPDVEALLRPGHPPHICGFLPLPGLWPGVLARRAQQASGNDRGIGHPHGQRCRAAVAVTAGRP